MTTRRIVLTAFAGILLAGCPGPQNPCTPTSCAEGSTCDSETGACVLACDETCEAHEYCSNRQCVPRYATVEVVRPREGGAVGRGSPVEASLTLASGATRADPTSLQFEVRGDGDAGMGQGALTRIDAGLFAGTLPDTLPEGVVLAVTARYPAAGLVSEKRYVTVDYTAPVFLLSWQAPDRQAGSPGVRAEERDLALDASFKRDELATIEVSAEEVVDPGTVYLRVYGVNDAGAPTEPGEPIAVTAAEGCGRPYCGAAVVDLAVPQFDVLRGRMQMVVTGKDEAGNDGAGDGGVPVTRLKWVYDYDSGDHFRASPSVGTKGNIYAGSAESLQGETGLVAAVNADGELLWELPLGGVTSSMPLGQMDGGDRVYVAPRTASGTTVARLLGNDGGYSAVSTPRTGNVQPSMALANTQVTGEPSPVETLYAFVSNGSSSEAHALRPDGKVGSQGEVIAVAEPGSYPATIVADGGDAYVVDAQGNLRAFAINADATGMIERYAKPVGLFITGSALTGTEFVGGGGPGVKAVFGGRPTDGGTIWKSPNTMGTPSSVVLDEVGTVYAGTSTGVLKAVPAGSTATVTERSAGQDFYGAPLLVEDERLYTASTGGRLVLWTRQLEPVWVGNFPGANFEASMNIDCARENGAKVPGRPGVLYLLDKGGVLYSVITDHALDTTALWPRYQRDPANTGNAASALQAYVCP